MLTRDAVQKLRILYQDNFMIAVDKPAGVMVHPPEDPALHRFMGRQPTVLRMLRDQVGKYLYPVHRLDGATSGALLMAFDSETAKKLQEIFKNQEVRKTYCALVRGFTDEQGRIDSPLTMDDEKKNRTRGSYSLSNLRNF